MKLERIVKWIRWPMLLLGLVLVPMLTLLWTSASMWAADPLTDSLWRLAAVLGGLAILLTADVLRGRRGGSAVVLVRYAIVGGALGLSWPIWGVVGLTLFEIVRLVPWMITA